MIIKNINGISYWKINSFGVVHNKIEISLQGYLNENDEQHMKLFSIDCPNTIIQNILNYSSLILALEDFIINNVEEFKT